MKVIKAPYKFSSEIGYKIFLAGSIEMGTAEKWQERLEQDLQDLDVVILNPRRDDWDSSWIQSIDNPQFREQVEWELVAMEMANLIVVYFDRLTKSPITLLKLGLHAGSRKLIVCCPEGFWRKGNVDIVCNRYGIARTDDVDNFPSVVKSIIETDMNREKLDTMEYV